MSAFLQHLIHSQVPLALAALLGGIVGFERETANRPAGLRTHVLVCVGAALAMQVSLYMYDLSLQRGFGNGDPGRIAAQVVSGIGFLGAGTIMREGLSIRGLTTAASLWVVAGVGLAAGAGMFMEATVAAVMMLVTLTVLSEVERRFIKAGHHHALAVAVTDTAGRLGMLASVIGRSDANIKNVQMRGGPVPGSVEITFFVKMTNPRVGLNDLIAELLAVDGVMSVTEVE